MKPESFQKEKKSDVEKEKKKQKEHQVNRRESRKKRKSNKMIGQTFYIWKQLLKAEIASFLIKLKIIENT